MRGDTLSRLGGDEFVALLPDLEAKAIVTSILKRLLQVASNPIKIDNLSLQLSASIGITFYPQYEAIDPDQLMRQADQAMYHAKQLGKNRYHFFDPELDRSLRSWNQDVNHIRKALENREFLLHYQPKVNMQTGEVIGVEALIRWQHPQKGLLPPQAFLPVIDNHPLIVALGDWVLEEVMKQLTLWHQANIKLSISVNIHASQLEQSDFIQKLTHLLQRFPNITQGDLEFEMLETSALEDIAYIDKIIHACHDLGIAFALDDFGTGYSSLTYLKRLPVATLKIDKSFVMDMIDDHDDLAIIEGTLELANTFDRKPIAEGVETPLHGIALLLLGCEVGQGYAIARPMSGRDIPQWLQSWSLPKVWSHYSKLTQENMPLLYAFVEHRKWIRYIIEYIHKQRLIYPPLDSKKCNFGQWLLETSNDTLIFQEIIALHQSIHTYATTLIEHFHNEERTIQSSDIEKLITLRDKLTDKLLEVLSSKG